MFFILNANSLAKMRISNNWLVKLSIKIQIITIEERRGVRTGGEVPEWVS